jgi:uncharacterized protein (DUF2237 family)
MSRDRLRSSMIRAMSDERTPTDRVEDRNVLGGPLQSCGTEPRTGFFRDGCCRTGPDDLGRHVVCAQVTEEFLAFTRARGNDLSTPVPAYGFPGLKPGDRWCLCATRWQEALEAGAAPPVVLEATHMKALEIVSIHDLENHALAPR